MATYLVIDGVNHAALVLALLVLIGRAAAPLGELATAGLHINDLFAALRNFNQITHPPELPEPLHPQIPTGHHISVQDVSYAPAIENMSLDIAWGAEYGLPDQAVVVRVLYLNYLHGLMIHK